MMVIDKMQERELEEIQGSVEDIIYRNPDSGFAVITLAVTDELVTVVGPLASVDVGEELKVTGNFTSHPTYGYQFKAELFEKSLPATAGAILQYLSSGAVKGIGPGLARRIVDQFGDETLEQIEKDPMVLAQIKGISEKKASELALEFKQIFGVRSVMLFLARFGISPAYSVNIWKTWGLSAVDFISKNPYIICEEEIGLPFETADLIANHLELSPLSPERITAGIRYVLSKNLLNGHTCLTQEKLLMVTAQLLAVETADVHAVLDKLLEDDQLISVERNKPYIYLPELFIAETYIANRISLMSRELTSQDDQIDAAINAVEKENHIEYETLQRQAIRSALTENVMILTGGPGTGKTTTLNAIIKIFEQREQKVLIAAPTGRAAKRISELTGREAKTIHRLLEVEYQKDNQLSFSRNEKNPLDCDVVVIDEMSMVDTLLFESLLRAMRLDCKLIMVGDSDQLPSVGAGNVLRDLIDSDCVTIVALKEIFRQAARSLIVTNAHAIVHGEMPDLSQKDNDFFFLSRENPIAALKTVIELVSTRLPNSYGYSPTEDIQVLCPSRKGDLGVENLNSKLQNVINPSKSEKHEFSYGPYTYREGDKVMQIKNNYDIAWVKGEEKGLGIFNGDIGTIVSIDKHNGYIFIDFDGRLSSYTLKMAEELELAYAITVHKSQGSEFPAVILPLLGGYDKLYYRNLLYTAVTRAKKILILVGSRQRVQFMVENNRKMLRYTGLKQFIIDYTEQ